MLLTSYVTGVAADAFAEIVATAIPTTNGAIASRTRARPARWGSVLTGRVTAGADGSSSSQLAVGSTATSRARKLMKRTTAAPSNKSEAAFAASEFRKAQSAKVVAKPAKRVRRRRAHAVVSSPPGRGRTPTTVRPGSPSPASKDLENAACRLVTNPNSPRQCVLRRSGQGQSPMRVRL